MAWILPTSTTIIDYCGHTPLYTLPKLLPFIVTKDTKLQTSFDQVSAWTCSANHTHYIVLDFGRCIHITSMQGLLNGTTNVKEVVVYITNDLTALGDPVLVVTDWAVYNKPDDQPYRYDATAAKAGRYAFIVVTSTHDASNALRWG